MGDVISIRNLVKTYGDAAAVDGVDLVVEQGECFALLGPNGAGKTTTVEILEGYRSRDSGEVTVLGHDPAHPTAAWRQRIGIVLQSVNDMAELTVEEMVRHFATYYARSRDVDELIALVGLETQRKARSRALSGGQRRRLDVALGIIGQPELLFLDEPTTGFDPEARREFWDLIGGLKRDGTTIVLTTHYLDEAEHLADRVAVIVQGRIVARGTPQSLGGDGDAAPVIRWTEGGVEHQATSAEPTRYVVELARRLGGEIPDLEIRRSTLEDKYLELIGRLREEA
jgi:ABC-2 type transport system ATP-binding protein